MKTFQYKCSFRRNKDCKELRWKFEMKKKKHAEVKGKKLREYFVFVFRKWAKATGKFKGRWAGDLQNDFRKRKEN